MPSPMETAQSQLWLEQERQKMAQQQAEQAKLEAEQKRQADLTAWGGKVDTAFNNAKNYGANRLSELGLADDPYGIMAAYEAELGTARTNVPELAADVNGYFGPQVFDNVYNRKRDATRTGYRRELDAFAGPDVGNTWFADTADDDILQSILNDQYTSSLDTLERQRSRGQLNQGAFEQALAGLETAKTGAMSKLQDTGMGILSNNRQQLQSKASSYYDRANNFDFGDSFNSAGLKTDFENFGNQLKGRLEGDIRGAVGDMQLFDVPTIGAKARTSQGMTNTSIPGGLYDMFKMEMDKRQTTNQQGAF